MLEKINHVLDKEVRPMLAEDGGNINVDKYEDGILYVRLEGVCSCCPRANETIKLGVERILKQHFPEIKEVIRLES